MLIIIFLVCIILILIGAWIAKRFDVGGIIGGIWLIVLAGLGCVGTFIASGIGINKLISQDVTRSEIRMLEEENNKIEEEFKVLIQTYMDYESGIIKDIDLENISSEKLLLITQVYPDLKANVFVQEQLRLHKENTDEIKSLKSQLLKSEVWRFWLYFGSPKVIEIEGE